MGEIGVSELGKTLNSNKDTGELTPYLCSINIHWTCINLEEVKKTRFTKEEQRKYILLKNDLLVCEGGDIGRCFIWDLPIPMYYQNALHRIRFYNEINPFFFKFAIEYYKNIHILDKYSKGVTIKHLTKTALHSICFPLPPLAEQKRIVEKIEELLALVDDLETNKTDLQSYIKQAKSKVLEMAVRGELVPQNPEDEPASALLEHIKKEQKSSKSKGKTTEHNTHYEEELLFDIPKNWAWCRLGEVCEKIETGNSINAKIKETKYKNLEEGFPYIGTKDISENHYIKYDNGIKIPFLEKFKVAKKNSVLLCIEGGSAGRKIGITNREVCFGNKLAKFYSHNISNSYILFFLMSEQFKSQFKESISGLIGGVSVNKLGQFVLPLPPLEEQHRIVEKIEEIFSELEFIEENLI